MEWRSAALSGESMILRHVIQVMDCAITVICGWPIYVHFLGQILGGELKALSRKANDEGFGLNIESFSLRYEAKLMFLEQGGFARREMRGFYLLGRRGLNLKKKKKEKREKEKKIKKKSPFDGVVVSGVKWHVDDPPSCHREAEKKEEREKKIKKNPSDGVAVSGDSGESMILHHVIEARSLLSVDGPLRPLFGALRRRAKKLSPEKRMMRGSDLT
ncbi:hypothetical protein CEXT_729461 [Caerostris extrusa]|uniref:Uncharacterized protein n=1 Tax=Caerostris extrusa TaxID=172846 RepID=A0AAV4W9G4_CAEEX|nr:hypothetical protein CEXT_729461 [Caerostris extrusa]